MNRLQNLSNERTDSPILLNNVNPSEIIDKLEIETNFETVFALNNLSSLDVNFKNTIESEELSNAFNQAFNYIKTIDFNMTGSSLFTGFTQDGLISWSGFDASILNDGTKDYTGLVNYTGNASYDANISRGIVFNFSNPVAIKTIQLYYIGATGQGNWKIEYWNGSSWIQLANYPIASNSGVPLTFNENGTVSSTKYRIFVSDWTVLNTNMYLHEAEAYKYLK